MEEWKDLLGTEGKIQVSTEGRIRSLLRGEPYILKTQKDSKGYERICFTIKRVKHSYKLHRAIAMTFIPNPDNLPQVNHIDGNKSNNSVSNLEWISNKDNADHAMRTGLWKNNLEASRKINEKRKKPVVAIKGNETQYFESISQAEKYFNSRHITAVLKGERDHVKGWSFCYGKEVV